MSKPETPKTPENPADNPLELVATDDLVAELARRYNAVVIAGWRDTSTMSDEVDYFFFGGRIPCLGMLNAAQKYIMAQGHVEPGDAGGEAEENPGIE